jgi:hypothetical protein
MANRIDVSIPDAAFTELLTHATYVATFNNQYLVTFDPKKRPTGQGMGEGLNLMYVQKAFEILTNDRSIVHHAKLDYDAFARDIKFANQMLAYKDAIGSPIQKITDNLTVVGYDLMEQANIVRAELEGLGKKNADYQKLFLSLNFVYEQRAKMAEATLQHNAEKTELKQQVAALVPPENK